MWIISIYEVICKYSHLGVKEFCRAIFQYFFSRSSENIKTDVQCALFKHLSFCTFSRLVFISLSFPSKKSFSYQLSIFFFFLNQNSCNFLKDLPHIMKPQKSTLQCKKCFWLEKVQMWTECTSGSSLKSL